METILLILVVGIAGALLTFARRYDNRDVEAGVGIASWTITLIILIILYSL